ncbi:hypothetical protein HDR59_00875 [bacterium]|nr:hypothetical protein [bacterium]
MKKVYFIVAGILGTLLVYFKGEENGASKQKAKQTKKILKKVNTKTKIKTRINTTSADKLHYRD